jgi:hypothetical protein
VAVERPDADPGAPRDRLERGVGSLLGEDVARGRDEHFVVALRTLRTTLNRSVEVSAEQGPAGGATAEEIVEPAAAGPARVTGS